jgi:hypothetical protein
VAAGAVDHGHAGAHQPRQFKGRHASRERFGGKGVPERIRAALFDTGCFQSCAAMYSASTPHQGVHAVRRHGAGDPGPALSPCQLARRPGGPFPNPGCVELVATVPAGLPGRWQPRAWLPRLGALGSLPGRGRSAATTASFRQTRKACASAAREPSPGDFRPGVHAPASSARADAVRLETSASVPLAGPLRVRCGKPVATGGKTPMFGRAG